MPSFLDADRRVMASSRRDVKSPVDDPVGAPVPVPAGSDGVRVPAFDPDPLQGRPDDRAFGSGRKSTKTFR